VNQHEHKRKGIYRDCRLLSGGAQSASADHRAVSSGDTTPRRHDLQVHVNSVLVPVVVRDAMGRAIGDLKQEDFKVLDQGKPRSIVGFTLQQGAPPASAGQSLAPAAASASQPAAAVAPPAVAERIIVFLFDDRHLGVGDLEQVKQAAVQMLDQPLPDGTRGLMLSFLCVNSGLTHNKAALQAAVMKIKERQVFQRSQSQCPNIDYYAADQILNKHNAQAYGIALDKAANCLHLLVPPSSIGNINVDDVSASGDLLKAEAAVKDAATISLQEGDQDADETIGYLRDVVHTISALPGQRTLILVSPGFLSLAQESMAMESTVLNLANGNGVTISTLDARGLYSIMVPASQGGGESIQSLEIGQNVQNRDDSMRQNKQVMAEFADGTGGTFFRNNNDLQGGLAVLAAGPAYKYLLELSLNDVKQNGSYHALKVEVDRKDVKIQAREGYFAPQPQKNKK
jgi:VWFA-related protein